MSVIQLLVMQPEKHPTHSQISEAARAESIPYQPENANLSSHTGFLPVLIGERKTGFEYYFAPVEDGQLPTEATQFGSWQMVARTGGDMAEMLASLLFFRTAAKLSGAAYVYPDDGTIIAPSGVDGFLSDQINQIGKFLK